MERLPAIVFCIIFIAAVLYPETVYRLRPAVTAGGKTVLLKNIVEETDSVPEISVTIGNSVFLSNQNISSVLKEMGFRDFILIGDGVRIVSPDAIEPEKNEALNRYPDIEIATSSGSPSEAVFAIRRLSGNSGEVFYQKGNISISLNVRIRGKLKDGVYLVENPMAGGKIMRIKQSSQGEKE